MSAPKITPAQRKVLENLAAGLEAGAHIRGMAAHGGLAGTVTALARRGYVRWTEGGGYVITDEGRAAL